MLDQIAGCVVAHYPQTITVSVTPGITLAILVPNELQFTPQQAVQLFIYFHWHQENGPTLYGFTSAVERQVFELIISCSGIGPKIGLAVLAHMSASDFVTALAEENVQALSAVQGIGKKKAETIILYLKDKAAKLLEHGVVIAQDGSGAQQLQDVAQTLSSLNYTKPEIASALDYVKNREEYKSLAFDGLLRKALIYLSKRS